MTSRARTSRVALRARARRLSAVLERRTRRYDQLLRVGIAMAAETDVDRLQHLILSTAREMTQADAGSLYLLRDGVGDERELLFLYAQNDSIETSFQRQALPLSSRSNAGYVALSGQIV